MIYIEISSLNLLFVFWLYGVFALRKLSFLKVIKFINLLLRFHFETQLEFPHTQVVEGFTHIFFRHLCCFQFLHLDLWSIWSLWYLFPNGCFGSLLLYYKRFESLVAWNKIHVIIFHSATCRLGSAVQFCCWSCLGSLIQPQYLVAGAGVVERLDLDAGTAEPLPPPRSSEALLSMWPLHMVFLGG